MHDLELTEQPLEPGLKINSWSDTVLKAPEGTTAMLEGTERMQQDAVDEKSSGEGDHAEGHKLHLGGAWHYGMAAGWALDRKGAQTPRVPV